MQRMQLQVNNSGAWKTVAPFSQAEREAVERAANAICHASSIVGGRVSFRIVDEAGTALAHCTAEHRWVNSKRAHQAEV